MRNLLEPCSFEVNMFGTIGILTGGGDAPGLNAVIRAVVKTATWSALHQQRFLTKAALPKRRDRTPELCHFSIDSEKRKKMKRRVSLVWLKPDEWWMAELSMRSQIETGKFCK